jgi:hypothetical protein
MARPERNNVDYFPFYCKEGKGSFVIETKYGNDGYSTWIKILRQLAVTNYHFLDLSNTSDFMFLSSKCKISEDILLKIIDDLAELGEIEKDLWQEKRIIFSVKFIESIQDAYKKRNNKCITLNGLRTLLGIKTDDSSPVNPVNSSGNPHTIVYNNKEENSIVDWTSEIFKDELFIEQLRMVNKGKDIQSAWDACYLFHSAKNPPQDLQTWKQKLISWLTRTEVKQSDNKLPRFI